MCLKKQLFIHVPYDLNISMNKRPISIIFLLKTGALCWEADGKSAKLRNIFLIFKTIVFIRLLVLCWIYIYIYCFKISYQKNFILQAICAVYGAYLASVLHGDVLKEFYNYYGAVLDRHYWIGLNDKATDRTYVWDKGKSHGITKYGIHSLMQITLPLDK